MAYMVIKLHTDGRLERAEKVKSWREREALIALVVFAQPALASLDVTAKLWRDLENERRSRSQQERVSAGNRVP